MPTSYQKVKRWLESGEAGWWIPGTLMVMGPDLTSTSDRKLLLWLPKQSVGLWSTN